MTIKKVASRLLRELRAFVELLLVVGIVTAVLVLAFYLDHLRFVVSK